MPKINPQDLDEDNEVPEELRNPTLKQKSKFKLPLQKSEQHARVKETKIARRKERLANQHWENTND